MPKCLPEPHVCVLSTNLFPAVSTTKKKKAEFSVEVVSKMAELLIGQSGLDTQYSEALGEHKFGILRGLNKDEARKRWSFEKWKRDHDVK
jgi:bisphosphoglycerate-dependent phosphoglycerate mutase